MIRSLNVSVLKRGSRGEEVKKLQEGLAFLGYSLGVIDGIFGRGTATAVSEFQSDSKLLADGIVGPSTLAAYETAIAKHAKDEFMVSLPPSVRSRPLVNKAPVETWVKCPADKFKDRDGYSQLTLRSDVANSYKKLYKEVANLGGIITTAGGKRGLKGKASPSRSKRSMHYVGRAFDLALPTGMQNPDTDPYIITRSHGDRRKWVVWCKSNEPDIDEQSGVRVQDVKLEGVYVVSEKNAKGKRYTVLRSKTIECRAFNFTELANKHGFVGISGRRSFFKGGSYLGAEWWHFQWTLGLQRGITTFGSDLLKVYSLEEAEKFIYWEEAKGSIWGVNWF